MQTQGTITQIVPCGGYQSQNGYIFTFQMSIQAEQGLIVGEIGSKSQTFPVAVGQPITVEVTNTQHGVRFKKVKPQYQNAPQGHQSPQNRQAPPQEDKRQDNIQWAQAVNLAFQGYYNGTVEAPQIQQHHKEIYELLKFRKFAPWMSSDSGVYNEPVDGQPQTVDGHPVDDDIPF